MDASPSPSVPNAFGQPVGIALPGWRPPQRPGREAREGRFCRLEPADPLRHALPLHEAYAADPTGALWTYLPFGPFATAADYAAWIEEKSREDDSLHFAVVDRESGTPLGLLGYLRIRPGEGAIELGGVTFSPALQRTAHATEASFLMIEKAFALGYRRCEWKCDSLNLPSRRAACRLGFTFEGIFRQALVVKGRNRDTAWFSILDAEWPPLRRAFATWLAPENFSAEGVQRQSLSLLTDPEAATPPEE